MFVKTENAKITIFSINMQESGNCKISSKRHIIQVM